VASGAGALAFLDIHEGHAPPKSILPRANSWHLPRFLGKIQEKTNIFKKFKRSYKKYKNITVNGRLNL
tara:strand:- start:195 stop:398 length:204 start_codon:yes stop_codon:yes gene_type:complete